MTPLEMISRVDANGVLNLSVALGKSDANRDVRVTLQMVEDELAPMTRNEWRQFVRDVAGSIGDPTFERHPQGEIEHRDDLFS